MQLATKQEGAGRRETLLRYYATLLQHFGPRGWWPARTRLEVILGAVLTQNTTWGNAALALNRLRKAGRLNLSNLRKTTQAELEFLIRPAGFFRQKALTIKGLLNWLELAYHGSLSKLFRRAPVELRRELLELRGLGPETVDAILLYAGGHAFFVADAYTRRILARHGLVPSDADYSSVQDFLHQTLPADRGLFNEYHALLVEVGKRYCKRQVPHCEACPLQAFLPEKDGKLGIRNSPLETSDADREGPSFEFLVSCHR